MDRGQNCSTCGKFKLNLRRCTGCFKVSYCSAECQNKDWKNGHKRNCKELKKSSTDLGKDTDSKRQNVAAREKHATPQNDSKAPSVFADETGPACEVCGSSRSDLRACSKCKSVQYCSKECQSKDWQKHKIRCGKEKLPDSEKATDNSGRQTDGLPACAVCKSSTNLRSCTRCKEVHYCSKHCQTSDWPKHKNECIQVDAILRTSGFKEHRKRLLEEKDPSLHAKRTHYREHSGFLPWDAFDPFSIFRRAHADVSRTKSSVENAIAKARKLYPMRNILDKFKDLPGEKFGMCPVGTGDVLLAYMSRKYTHAHRHGMYLKDKNEEETYAVFNFDWDNPPSFSWSDIKPGRYICLEDAFIHVSVDGTHCIRIAHSSDVKIFDV